MLETFYKNRKLEFPLLDKTIVYDKTKFNKNPIMIIGEAPGETEVINGIPFCGPAGKNLQYLIKESGLSREDFLITNMVPFRTYKYSGENKINRTPSSEELKAGAELLREEIEIIKPRLILLLGGSALKGFKYFKKIDIKTNEIKFFDNLKIGHSYHPSPIAFNRKEIKNALLLFFKNLPRE